MENPVDIQKKERRRQMRFIPIGITSGADLGKILNVSDYSDEKYDAVQLREGNRNNLVLIMHSKKTSPMEWKVAYGSSTIFFNTLEEAVAFCDERGMKLMKGGR